MEVKRASDPTAIKTWKRKQANLARLYPTDPLGGRTVSPVYAQFWLPLIPSKNQEPSNMWTRRKVKKHWEYLADLVWRLAECPRFDSVYIRVSLSVWALRDEDNSNGVAFKGFLDGLKGKLMVDDRPEYLTLLPFEQTVNRSDQHMLVWVTKRLDTRLPTQNAVLGHSGATEGHSRGGAEVEREVN